MKRLDDLRDRARRFVSRRAAAWAIGDTIMLPRVSFDYVVCGESKFHLTKEIADFRRPDDNPWYRNIYPEDVCLDLGACVGAVAIPLARMAAQVIAVEPLFEDDLLANIHLNELGTIQVLPYGLGKTNERQRLAFSSREAFCDMLSFADMLEAVGKPVDVLKVDVEGAEWDYLPREALEGIRELRLEFHIRRGRERQDMAEIDGWRSWFRVQGHDVIEERGRDLPIASPFAFCFSFNASRPKPAAVKKRDGG